MNEEVLNMSVRKFLKKLGVQSQRELEQAIREAVRTGRLQGKERLPVRAQISLPAVGLTFEVDGTIELA